MTSTENCRAYWRCNLGKSVGLCCPPGKIYRPYFGCVNDVKNVCKAICPPISKEGQGKCTSRTYYDDPKFYEKQLVGWGWVKMPCAPGTVYDHAQCGCAQRVAVGTTHAPPAVVQGKAKDICKNGPPTDPNFWPDPKIFMAFFSRKYLYTLFLPSNVGFDIKGIIF